MSDTDKQLIETLRAIQSESQHIAVAGAAGRAADRIEADAERIAELERGRENAEKLKVAEAFERVWEKSHELDLSGSEVLAVIRMTAEDLRDDVARRETDGGGE